MHLTRENSTRSTAVASEPPMGLMPVGGAPTPAHGAARPAHTAALRVRAHDFLSLTKPRVLLLVLIATGLGWVMAAAALDVGVLVHALLGTALVAGGTAGPPQHIQRARRGRMPPTARRALPPARRQPPGTPRSALRAAPSGTR